jgi:cysteine synthase A
MRQAVSWRMASAIDANRSWIAQAIAKLDEDRRREVDTPLLGLGLPELPGCRIYIKDETAHPTGSLKHRLARSLFLHAICNGDIREHTTVVEASSGSTAISEAYFANLLGLPFIAVVPIGTATAKREAIARAGAQIHLVEPHDEISVVAARVARDMNGHFMDQFTFAERATDWRGNNNIAESLFAQLAEQTYPIPRWIVVGAGTGGTSATIGRYIRYQPKLNATRLCVVDPEGSAFFPYFEAGDPKVCGGCGGIIEGIGRARVEPSFMRNVVDRMMAVPDAASIAGARWLESRLERRFGPSTGTNIIGALALAAEMQSQGESGSVATLACDLGDRYADTIYDDTWVTSRKIDLREWQQRLQHLHSTRRFGHDLQRADLNHGPIKSNIMG